MQRAESLVHPGTRVFAFFSDIGVRPEDGVTWRLLLENPMWVVSINR